MEHNPRHKPNNGDFYETYWKERKDSGNRYRYKVFLSWIPERSEILDVGCGDGYLGKLIKDQKHSHVVGLDISETALQKARSRGLETKTGSLGEPLPFHDGSFDQVIATEVIEHVPNSEAVLKEMMRIARKNILVSIPNTGFWKYRLQLLRGRFPKQWLLDPSEHLRFWTITDFRNTIRQLGFKIEDMKAGSGRRYIRDWWPGLFAEQVCFKIARREKKIFVNSYTYTYERHLRMFDFFANKKSLIFILPKLWKAKGGKIKVTPPEKPEFHIVKTWAPFHHSHYPIIKGMLKGWQPWSSRILRSLARPGDVLLSSAEPNLLTTYLYGRLAKKLGLKHVFLTWQNIEYTKRLSGWKLAVTEWLLRKNIELAAGALSGTKQAYGILKPYLNDKIKTAIIPQSGVDTEIFKPGIQSDFRQKYRLEGKMVYLFAAVFDERKGVFTTIEAFHKTLSQVPDGHLVMIGIGKLWSPAQDLVQKLNIADKVTFIEWLPNHELPGIFTSVDILVHPSEPYKDWEEQYGWTLLQASASGLPIIATTIGAISEAVIDKKTGILVEPKNVDALAKTMVYLAQNPTVRKDFGTRGVEFILANFSHKKIAERLETFLNSL